MTGWLELPSGAGFSASSAVASNSSYYKGVYYSNGTESGSGSGRNYSYLYQYSTYTSLWVAYPLYSGVMSSSAPDASYSSRYVLKSSAGRQRNIWNNGTYVSGNNGYTMSSNEGYSGVWTSNPFVAKAYQVNIWDGSYNVILGQTDYVSDAATACGTDGDYYARGHQIPNADRNQDDDMQAQTFVATNSTPQIQKKFNTTIWSAVERAARDCARGSGANDTVYVATGAAFQKVGESKTITYIHPKKDSGKSVPVPNYYWKVLLKVKWSQTGKVSSAMAVGVWIPHEQYDSSDYSSFVTSVSQIEQYTGFDFFTNLPASLKSTAKANDSWTTFQNFTTN